MTPGLIEEFQAEQGSEPHGGGESSLIKEYQSQQAAPQRSLIDEYRQTNPEQPGFGEMIKEALKEQGRGLVQFLKYDINGETTFEQRSVPAIGGSRMAEVPVTAKQRDRQAAQMGDVDAALRVRRGDMGAALVASTIAASAATGALGVRTATSFGKKATRFLAAEAIGGGVYGAIDPGDRSRARAMTEDAITFPIMGAAMHGAFKTVVGGFKGLGAIFSRVQPEVTQAIKEIKTEAQANKVAKSSYDFFNQLAPKEEAAARTAPEIIELQAQAVTEAVKKEIPTAIPKDIPTGISKSFDPLAPAFPKMTSEHRKVVKQMLGSDAGVYEAAYKNMKEASSGEAYAKHKKLMTSMEAKLKPEQRAQLRALDNAGWEDDLAEAIQAGDDIVAADIATTMAVEGTKLADVATPDVQTELAKMASLSLKEQVAASPRIVASKAQTQKLAEELTQSIKDLIAKNDTEGIATKIALDATDEISPSSLGDLLPASSAASDVPPVANNAAVLYNRASEAVKKLIEDEGGTIATRQAARLGLGAAAYGVEQLKDPDGGALSFRNNSLHAVAGFLALAAVMPGPRTAAMLNNNKWTRKIIGWADIGKTLSTEGADGRALWESITGKAQTEAVFQANDLRRMLDVNPTSKFKPFKLDHQLNERFALAIDEGPASPEWHMLTPDQQNEAASLRHLDQVQNGYLAANYSITNAKDNYYQHVLPKETYNAWKERYTILKKTGTPQQVAQFESLREVKRWAKQEGLPEPIEDVSQARAKHMVDVGRLVAGIEAERFFEAKGLIRDVVHTPSMRPPEFRQIKGTQKMAPDDIATLMERIKEPSFSIGFIDRPKGAMMTTIMAFPWEHGINLARAQAAFDPFLKEGRLAMAAIKNSDPLAVEGGKYVQLFRRPDVMNEASEQFNVLMKGLGLEKLNSLRHAGERMLWERWAPAVGLSAWALEMKKWTQKTGGRYLIGSPEYEIAARAAGDYANNMVGKIPDLMQDKVLAAGMRALMFSPSWTRTRMSILAHAAGELQHIAAGEMNPSDAVYLQTKMRSVALGVAFTYILSRIWGKEDPEFNPNTTKLYARTGLYDDRGRELGVDLVGWWQDDIKVFNDPLRFLEHRMNPLLRVVTQGINGRDAFGNEVVGMDRFENLVRQFGPPTVVPDILYQAGKSVVEREFDAREAVKTGSEFLAVGNVSSLPRMEDVMLAKYAEKILRMNDLPVTREDTYELSSLMKHNHRQSNKLVGKNIESYIGYRLHEQEEKNPLWMRAKRFYRNHVNE